MANPVQTVKQAYTEWANGNLQGMLNLLADDVTLKGPGYPEIPFGGGTRTGKSEVEKFFLELQKAVTYSRWEPQEFFHDGNHVTVKGVMEGKVNSTGKPVKSDFVQLWEVEDGKVKSNETFFDTVKVATALKK